MKVVIDTNVVVSAALKDRIPEEIILFITGNSDFDWVVSQEILSEYRHVLRRPRFNLPEEITQKWDTAFDTFARLVEVDLSVNFSRDQKDAKFLACALATDAEFLITGDRDFSEATKLNHTTIISASLFKKLVCDTWT